MTAASFWSLLAPAIEMAEDSGLYGQDGEWAFVPAAFGFLIGAVFVWGTDKLLPHLVRRPTYYLHIFYISTFIHRYIFYVKRVVFGFSAFCHCH